MTSSLKQAHKPRSYAILKLCPVSDPLTKQAISVANKNLSIWYTFMKSYLHGQEKDRLLWVYNLHDAWVSEMFLVNTFSI